ncbi:hypothetical protein FHY31_000039 [Xanthomonas euvesicatoria]|uniref:Uncharacterized protein n=1 Tax=Xanthomonas euvesicatoria TaxID=456327 RepID=A0AAW3TX05_XANEU|nr:hypothetical protein [Xanthomonas euvesicatoria]MBB4868334.1 hypothetical protein [Xanthomonas euvesicatoria]
MSDQAAPARKGMNTSDLDSLQLRSTRQSQARHVRRYALRFHRGRAEQQRMSTPAL